MANLIMYSYGKCSTCRKATKYLEQKKIPFKLVDLSMTAPSESELKQVLSSMDGNLKKLFNTSGQVYRNDGYADKLKAMSENDAIKVLSQTGMLVKRPMLISGKRGISGFNEASWDDFLQND